MICVFFVPMGSCYLNCLLNVGIALILRKSVVAVGSLRAETEFNLVKCKKSSPRKVALDSRDDCRVGLEYHCEIDLI